MIRTSTPPACRPHAPHLAGTLSLLLAAGAANAAPPPPDSDLDPGLTVRIHEVAEPLERLQAVAEGQTPNIDRLMPRLDLDRAAFDPATAPFVTEVLGWLVVDEPGAYRFELTSDDGARLTIGGTAA